MFGFIYSLVAYLAFFAAFTGLVFFNDGLLLPKTVDSGVPGPVGLAIAINLGLALLWGVQHSVMAREGFKRWLTRFVPKHLERSTFVLASAVVLVMVMALWQPLPGVLWQVESAPFAAGIWALNALGWLGVPVVSFLIDHFDLFGLKQPFLHWRKQSYSAKGFVMPWLYRYVRHPMMTAIMVALWTTPLMTASHLMFSLVMTAYIFVGVYFEERSLRRELGEAYAAYQQRVPKLLPRLGGPSELPVVAAPTTAQG